MKSISRSSGGSAPGAAAYRAGERIRDERTGQLHDYSDREDVSHAEILLPAAIESSAPDWIRDRAALWNAAEAAEVRRNSRVAREYQVALPVELPADQRLALAQGFGRELADRYRVVVDLGVHGPRAAGDPRNFHAHLLTTTRELTASGLGAKAQPEWNGTKRAQHGLQANRLELIAIRERWADLTNEAFRAAGLDLRIDHRSLAAQGIDREPLPRIPYAAVQIERRGMRSEVAERIRAQYQARVSARHQASAAAAREPSSPPRPGIEEQQRRAREAWLQIRRTAQLGLDAGPQAAPGLEPRLEPRLEPQLEPALGAGSEPGLGDTARQRTQDRDYSL
jgi:ATP-dependent exoDNAse (exonuclease V) alpha subunit